MHRDVSQATPLPKKGIALAFACLFLLGLMPILTQGRPEGSSALIFAVGLSLWQLLFSLPLLAHEWRSGERGALRETLSPGAKRRTLAIALFTGLLFALSTWMYVLAFDRVGAVNAAIALQAYPLFAAGLEASWLGQRKSRAEVFFTLLILAALYHLATGGTWRTDGLSLHFALALAVPALWSVAHLILRQSLVTTPITPNQVTTSRLLVVIAVLLPLAFVLEGPGELAATVLQPSFQAFAVTMGLAYYLELILWFNAVKHIDVSLASSITVPAPAVTMVLAASLLAEPIRSEQMVALAVVALGLYGLLRASASRARAAQA